MLPNVSLPWSLFKIKAAITSPHKGMFGLIGNFYVRTQTCKGLRGVVCPSLCLSKIRLFRRQNKLSHGRHRNTWCDSCHLTKPVCSTLCGTAGVASLHGELSSVFLALTSTSQYSEEFRLDHSQELQHCEVSAERRRVCLLNKGNI